MRVRLERCGADERTVTVLVRNGDDPPLKITGVKLGGILPWEEIAFFFLTSLLVAQSYLLLLPEDLR